MHARRDILPPFPARLLLNLLSLYLCLILPQSLPISANPAWCRAPSFAAAAALLVPPSGGGSSGVQHAPSAADLAAAAAVVDSAGLTSRVLWAAGCQQLHFVYSTPYDHLVGLAHRQAQLLPMTLANLAPRHGGSSTQAAAAAGSDAAAEQRRQAERIFAEVAADQRAGGLRLLGWLLSHLFRWGGPSGWWRLGQCCVRGCLSPACLLLAAHPADAVALTPHHSLPTLAAGCSTASCTSMWRAWPACASCTCKEAGLRGSRAGPASCTSPHTRATWTT